MLIEISSGFVNNPPLILDPFFYVLSLINFICDIYFSLTFLNLYIFLVTLIVVSV